jgi:YD repeat-containing protein
MKTDGRSPHTSSAHAAIALLGSALLVLAAALWQTLDAQEPGTRAAPHPGPPALSSSRDASPREDPAELGHRPLLPVVLRGAPAPLKPVPTVVPSPAPPEDRYADCTVDEVSEAWIDGVLYRTVSQTTFNAASQPLRREYLYEDKHGDHVYVYDHVYDRADKLVRIHVRSESAGGAQESETAYEYDADGRLTRVAHMANNETRAEHVYTYDAAGNLVGETWNNKPAGTGGLNYRMAYDDHGRRIRRESISHWTGEVYAVESYTWDPHRVTESTLAYVNDGTVTAAERSRYGYDAHGRLVWVETRYSITKDMYWVEYRYGDHGEIARVEERDGAGTLQRENTYLYDASGRLLEHHTVESPSGSTSLLRRRTLQCPD